MSSSDASPTPSEDGRQGASSLLVASSVSLAVYSRLRREILSGEVAAGSRLHQGELARRYGVSITPVREALSALVTDGLVDSTPYSGATVHQPTVREIDEVYELRAALTPMLVVKAVESITDDGLARATEIAHRMVASNFDGVWSEENRAFHRALEAGCDNRQLVATMAKLADLSLSYVSLSVAVSEARKAQASDEHFELLDLYRRRDWEAATEVTLRHIKATHELVRSALSNLGATGTDGTPVQSARV